MALESSDGRVSATYVRLPYLRWVMYRTDASRKMLLRRIGWRAGLLDIEMFERIAFKTIANSDIGRNTDIFQINGLPRLGAWIEESLHKKAVVLWHGPPGPEARRWNERCSATLAYGGSVDAVKSNADAKAVEISIGVDTEICRRISADGIRSRYEIPAGRYCLSLCRSFYSYKEFAIFGRVLRSSSSAEAASLPVTGRRWPIAARSISTGDCTWCSGPGHLRGTTNRKRSC